MTQKTAKTIAQAICCCLCFALCLACREPLPKQLLRRFPLDSLNGVLDKQVLFFAPGISHDGRGSLEIRCAQPGIYRLFRVNKPPIEGVTLIYKAFVRSRELQGEAMLEMRVKIHDKLYYSRGKLKKISGTSEFTELDTLFFLKRDHLPDFIQLNVVVNGTGTIWVDDIRLYAGPLTFLRAKEF